MFVKLKCFKNQIKFALIILYYLIFFVFSATASISAQKTMWKPSIEYMTSSDEEEDSGDCDGDSGLNVTGDGGAGSGDDCGVSDGVAGASGSVDEKSSQSIEPQCKKVKRRTKRARKLRSQQLNVPSDRSCMSISGSRAINVNNVSHEIAMAAVDVALTALSLLSINNAIHQIAESNLQKCQYCTLTMPAAAMQAHIQRAHIQCRRPYNVVKVKCQYCSNSMPQSSIQKHIQKKHIMTNKN